MTGYVEQMTESSLRNSINAGLRTLAGALERGEAIGYPGEPTPVVRAACQQVSGWLRQGVATYDGRVLDLSWFRCLLAEELDDIRHELGEETYWAGEYCEAGRLFNELAGRLVN